MRLSKKTKVNKDNFFIATSADWQKVKLMYKHEVEEMNEKANFISASGSSYFYTPDGVYRISDHWMRNVSSCDWLLDGEMFDMSNAYAFSKKFALAFCKWSDFERKVDTQLGLEGFMLNREFHPFNGRYDEYKERFFNEYGYEFIYKEGA